MKTITISIVPQDDSFKDIVNTLEQYESSLEILDIELLEEYNNIIFDSNEKDTEKLIDVLKNEVPDSSWQLMKSEGEKILEIILYNNGSLSCEKVNMTMEEISKACSNGCESCSGCGGCSGCSGCESADNIINKANTFFDSEDSGEKINSLIYEFHTSLEEYVEKSVEDCFADEAESLFYDSLARVIISAAASDGTYTEKEHEHVTHIFGNVSFNVAKKYADTENTEDIMKTISFWKDAQAYAGCNVVSVLIKLCALVCSCDGNINAAERTFIKKILCNE